MSSHYILPFQGTVTRIVPALFLQRCSSPSNVDDCHVAITLPRLTCLERAVDTDAVRYLSRAFKQTHGAPANWSLAT